MKQNHHKASYFFFIREKFAVIFTGNIFHQLNKVCVPKILFYKVITWLSIKDWKVSIGLSKARNFGRIFNTLKLDIILFIRLLKSIYLSKFYVSRSPSSKGINLNWSALDGLRMVSSLIWYICYYRNSRVSKPEKSSNEGCLYTGILYGLTYVTFQEKSLF